MLTLEITLDLRITREVCSVEYGGLYQGQERDHE